MARPQRSHIDDLALRSSIQDLAAGRIQGAQDAARCRCFAAATFANQTQRFSLFYVKVYAIDGPNIAHHLLEEAFFDGKEFLQVFYFQ